MLLRPTTELFDSFQESLAEWGNGFQDGASIHDAKALRTREGFAAWVRALLDAEHQQVRDGWVTCSHYWIVEDGEYVGAVSLRHELNDHLRAHGGHIGYSVRPSRRGHGLATRALGEVLDRARARGIGEVLLTCDEDNYASQHVIRANGGELADVLERNEGPGTMRWWIRLSPSSAAPEHRGA